MSAEQHPAAAHDAASGRERACAASGLVRSETSHTPSDLIQVNPRDNRLRRMRSGVITAARLVQDRLGPKRWRVAMLTLTYRPDVDWNPKQISALVTSLRNWAKRRGYVLPYVWVMELHKSGRPHYHMLVWLPRGLSLPKPDKQGWWKCGLTKIEWARRAVGYIAKYASKGHHGDGSQFPKACRIHGCGGLDPDSRIERSWWLSPKWVRDAWPIEHAPKPAPGGGWFSRLTGDWLPSPYEVVGISGGIVHVRRVGQ